MTQKQITKLNPKMFKYGFNNTILKINESNIH